MLTNSKAVLATVNKTFELSQLFELQDRSIFPLCLVPITKG